MCIYWVGDSCIGRQGRPRTLCSHCPSGNGLFIKSSYLSAAVLSPKTKQASPMKAQHCAAAILMTYLFGANTFADKQPTPLHQIKTVVVIYAENRSFDNLYGLFPGADGILKKADGKVTDLSSFR